MPSEQEILIQEFLSDALEHLEGIETLILQFELPDEKGREDRLNKVFRAAHSIKGDSSMFGFKNIQRLSHGLESLLDRLRSKELSSDGGIVDLLLKGFDKLRVLVRDSNRGENIDISSIIRDVETAVSRGKASSKAPPVGSISVEEASRHLSDLHLTPEDLSGLASQGEFVYLLRFDLVSDIDLRGKSLMDLAKLIPGFGRLLDSFADFGDEEPKGGPSTFQIPFKAVYSSFIPPEEITALIELPETCIQVIQGDTNVPATARATASALPTVTARDISPSPEQSPGPAAHMPGTTLDPTPDHPGHAIPPAGIPREAANGEASAPLEQKISPEPLESTLRVRVSLLERLMNLAGELVLSRNQLREALSQSDMRAINASGQRINIVTSELQEAIMTTRLQPIDRIFSKIPRMVRDVSKELNKEIELHIEGREVELDKTLIEGLGDPLTHMIRNAVDHGIENDDERLRAGKPLPAKIRVGARYEAGQVVVEIGDDGRGIDLERVTQRAVSMGLVPKEKLERLSENEKLAFIFLPGFSTSETVTSLSGRGVGMDVVKTNIDQLGGKVEIETRPKKGTVFRIKLPLTLAIIPSLIVANQGELFAIPQINVVELLRIQPEQVKRRIEMIGGQEVLLLRGELLPLIDLAEFLGIRKTFVHPKTGDSQPDQRVPVRNPDEPSSPPQNSPVSSKALERRYHSASNVNIVVVTTGLFSYGIIVDQMMFSEEIVVKPLGRYLKSLPEYSGATVMGNGQIALIFDIAGLATRTRLSSISGKGVRLRNQGPETAGKEPARESNRVSFLTFPCGGSEKYALPLYMVLRIETVRAEKIERFGGWATVPNGERVLPVLALSEVVNAKPIRSDQDSVIVVTEVRGREIGILGAMPPEVLEIPIDFDSSLLRRPGIAGSRVEGGTTLLMIDLLEILQTTRPELLEFPANHPLVAGSATRIILVEKHGYFRRQIGHLLEQAGFLVTPFEVAEEAVKLLESSPDSFKAILADVNILSHDAFQLTARIRSAKGGSEIPIIGLSLDGQEEAAALGRKGIDGVNVKLDHFGLLKSLSGIQ